MKVDILIIIAFLIVISYSRIEKHEMPQRTVITGQVSNFEKVSKHDFIEFVYEDILGGQVILAENINENGQFKFVLELDYPTEFFLKYSGLLTYYISPGDSLHFYINGDCWSKVSDTRAEEYGYYKISGTSEKMNKDIANYTAFYLDSINKWNVHDSMIRNSTPRGYQIFRENLTKQRLKIIDDFNTKK